MSEAAEKYLENKYKFLSRTDWMGMTKSEIAKELDDYHKEQLEKITDEVRDKMTECISFDKRTIAVTPEQWLSKERNQGEINAYRMLLNKLKQ